MSHRIVTAIVLLVLLMSAGVAVAQFQCPPGQLCFDGMCIDPDTDERYCGACGNVCDPGFLCENGQCVPCAPVSSDEVRWGVVKSFYR